MILSTLLLIPLAAHSNPVTFNDNDNEGYWGGNIFPDNYDNSYKDVIGSPYFSVDQMVVTQNGNDWTVTLSGNYFDCRLNSSCDGGLASRLVPGDLYLSIGDYDVTQVSPEDHFKQDVFSLSEGWNYVVPLNHLDYASKSGTTGLYTFTGQYEETNAPSGYIYRTDQAWRGGAGVWVGDASYEFDYLNDSLIFTFNTSNISLAADTEIGFHWAMQCGNDILEGAIVAEAPPSVPEPSTLLLLGLGLTGVAVYKKFRS